MTSPAKRSCVRVSALPEPVLVSLVDDHTGSYADFPDGWWTEYGGAVDTASGVVYLPGPKYPPCPFTCPRCDTRGTA
jgi:hypothetical protein